MSFAIGDKIRNINTGVESRIVLIDIVDGKTVYQTDEPYEHSDFGFVRFGSDYAKNYEKTGD